MREMKNSGIEWIGDIPSDWNIIKLCYVTDEIFLGKTPIYSEEHNENYTLGQKNNQLYGIDFNGIKFSTDEHFNACKENEFLKYGDILLNSLGTGSVGRIGFFDSNKRMLTDGHIIVIRPNNKINNKYLFYYLRTLRKKFEDDAVGSTNQAFLTVPKIYKTLVPFPDAYMQKKIADFLDEKCAEIDTVIEKTKATIEEYKKLKQSVITQAVTKGIRPNRPMKESGIEWIGEIPADWEHRKLFRAIDNMGDIDHYMPDSVMEYGVPYLMTGDLKPQLSEIAFDKCKQVSKDDYILLSSKIKAEKGDVIFARYATIGTVCYVNIAKDFLVSYSCLTIKPSKEYLDGKFLFYYLKSAAFFEDIKQYINSNTQSNVGLDSMCKARIVLPNIYEQKEIIDYLDKKCSEIDELIAKKTSLLSELESYKKSLIYEYVTGKKEVTQ